MTAQVLNLTAGLLIAMQLAGQAAADADAQYTVQREFTSPISGEVFMANVLRDELQVNDWDHDWCPHPPINTLAYTLVIDPRTGYVAPPDQFEQPASWDEADLAQIIGEPRFRRLAPEGLPWAGAYAWEKLENAALLAHADGEPAYMVGNWWLMAAWSVRLDVLSGHNEFDAQVWALFADLPRRGPDPADLLTPYQLQLAAQWEDLRATGQLPDISASSLSLALAWLYRSRGELIQAENWLHDAALNNQSLPSDDPLYQYLLTSIELERYYLRHARRWLIQAWNDAEFLPTQEAGSAFLLAELNRRLGDMSAAVFWYDEASAKNMGLLNPDLISLLRAKASGGNSF